MSGPPQDLEADPREIAEPNARLPDRFMKLEEVSPKPFGVTLPAVFRRRPSIRIRV